MEVFNVIACQNILGEGPIWSPEEDALYWVDITGKKVQRFFPETRKYEFFNLTKKISVLAMREKGGFVCAAEDAFHFLDPAFNKLEMIAHPEQGKSEGRFNDGKVDRLGRFWAGTMTPQGASSALYRMDADLSIHRMAADITISNGIGWSLDNKTMYYVDSNRYVIYAYDFDIDTGSIFNQRDFLRFETSYGVPDGLTVDAEGFIWCAIYDGWKVIRIHPGGKIMEEIPMPVSKPSSVAFGGKNMDELYVTSISEGLNPNEKAEQPMAGDLFMFRPGVKGMAEPKFAG